MGFKNQQSLGQLSSFTHMQQSDTITKNPIAVSPHPFPPFLSPQPDMTRRQRILCGKLQDFINDQYIQRNRARREK